MTSKNTIRLVSIVRLDVEKQMELLPLRNTDGVRKMMFTDHVISTGEHQMWIQGLKNDNSRLYFAVLDDSDSVLGSVSLTSICQRHLVADWGFYLAEHARGGLGKVVLFELMSFAFEALKLEKLNGQTIDGNKASISVHKTLQFIEEGFRRSNVVKDGKRLGVWQFGMTRDEWFNVRDSVRESLHEAMQKYDVRIEYEKEGGPLLGPIDKIEAARAKNNVNWMNILRIALEKSPAARPIVDDIRRIDKEISSLTDELLADGGGSGFQA